MVATSILFVFATVIVSSFVETVIVQDNVICAYNGVHKPAGGPAKEIPAGCEAVMCGYYLLDDDATAEDKATIKALTSEGIIVYVKVGWLTRSWENFLNSNPKDETTGSLVNFINDCNVGGIFIDDFIVFGGNTLLLDLFVNFVNDFEPKLKKSTSFILGVMIPGDRLDYFTSSDLSTIDTVVSVYMIDLLPIRVPCSEVQKETGRYPTMTLTDFCTKVNQSALGTLNIMVNFKIDVSSSDDKSSISYSEFCNLTSEQGAAHCADNPKLFNEEAGLLSNTFDGIMFSDLDSDDYDNKCGCGKYSVTNMMIAAWNDPATPVANCPKIG